MQSLLTPDSLFIYLRFRRYFKDVVELQSNSLQILGVLEAVDEVAADDVRVIRERVIRAVHGAVGLLLAENALVAFRAPDVLGLDGLDEVCERQDS